MTVAVFATLGLAAAILVPARRHGSAAAWFAAAVAAGWFLWLAAQIPAVTDGEVRSGTLEWVTALGVSFAWRLDGLSLVMALVITGVGAPVLAYTGAYATGSKRATLLALLLAFVAAMLGLATSDNVLGLFIFWELTSILSFLLIGLDSKDGQARRSATQALLVTGAGGLALLGGLLLLGISAGTWRISEMADSGFMASGGTGLAALLLVAAGAFTKSAQFPFHFWLPNAMVAPAPVSAYLHSAAMVKAGVFVLARLQPVLSGMDAWGVVLLPVGATTALLGAWFAVRHSDMKKVFAYTTISALGVLVLLLGTGSDAGAKAAIVFLVGHSLYKAALFMATGAVDHATGTRDLRVLRGLARRMPGTAAVLALAGLSLAGLPPFLGYVGKETLIAATLDHDAASALTAAAVAVGALSIVAAAVACLRPLAGSPVEEVHDHGLGWPLWAAPLVLAVAGLGIGLALAPMEPLVAAAAEGVAGRPVKVHLSLVPPSTDIAMVSALAIGAGVSTAGWVLWRNASLASPSLPELGDRGYDAWLAGLAGSARAMTEFVQSGSLQRYLLVIVVTAVGLAGIPLLALGAFHLPEGPGDAGAADALVGVVIVAGAAFAAFSRPGMRSAAALGITGLGIALLYAILGAPDLAMTQVLVETLTVILFAFVFSRLPRGEQFSSRGARLRDLSIAVAAGALVTLFVWSVGAEGGDRPLTAFFGENSYAEAFGRNVVNVILVDFRALDTLGEITVLAVAAAGVIALLRSGRRKAGS